MNICVSSFTGESDKRNDGLSVISEIYSTCLVYIILDLGTFKFWYTKAIRSLLSV